MTLDEVQDWRRSEVILISAPTGKGKSHFVKTILREHLKSKGMTCLYLLSRQRTLEQFQKELPDDDVINFATYQGLEALIINPENPYQKYDVVIADECHYFLDDASFNRNTDLSIGWILNQTDAIKVFMSATHEFISEYLNELRIMYVQYYLPGDYNKVTSLSFYWHDAQLPVIADEVLSSNEKAIFFIQSAEQAFNLFKRYEDRGMFLCSAHNPKFSRFMDNTLVSELLADEQFDCNLLFSTTALDTGVTLKDRELTYILIDVVEPVKIIQCLGRKRFIDENDNVSLYIRGRTNQQISGLMRKCQDGLNLVSEFQTNGAITFNAEHGRGNGDSGLIYDSVLDNVIEPVFEKRINMLKYSKLRYDMNMYRQMLDLGDFGYLKYVANLLGKSNYTIMEEVETIKNLTQFLESMKNVPMLIPSDRKELIGRLNIRQDGKLCRAYRVLASWLESSNLPYRLETFRKTITIDGKRRNYENTWMIVGLEDDVKSVLDSSVNLI